jgi:hypothetical protein
MLFLFFEGRRLRLLPILGIWCVHVVVELLILNLVIVADIFGEPLTEFFLFLFAILPAYHTVGR